MKIRSLSTIIILAVLSIIGIGSVQFFWFKKAFDLKEKQFNQSVLLSLQTVGESILNYNQMTIPAENLVEQISGNYFVVHTNAEIDLKILEHLIRGEFEKRSIQMDFEYGVYDCFDDKLIYGNYVPMDDSELIPEDMSLSNRTLPTLENDSQYFGVLFPTKENTLLSQMGIWVFSTFTLLLVFTFFGVSISILFRQKKLSDMQKDFVNNMTHEFKTPLYTIMVTTDLLKQPTILQNQESALSYLDILGKEALRLKNQIERILLIASSDKGRLDLQLEDVDLHDCIGNAVQAARTPLASKQGTIECDFQAQQSIVLGDKMHIENVIYNLVENAIKYTESPPQIKIATYNDKKNIIISVKDNGIGIDPSQFQNIFKRFYRVPTGNTHNVKGFGLGLSYVREIVMAHKGKVSVNSQQKEGSTFIIELPNKK